MDFCLRTRWTERARRLGTPGGRRWRDEKRSIPERIPAILGDHLWRQLDAGRTQGIRLLRRHPPDASDDAVFRYKVFAKRDPGAGGFAHSEIANCRLSAINRIAGADLGIAFPLPGH